MKSDATKARTGGDQADRCPIFIIGAGRCGTNLLRMMLNAHPRIHIAHEVGLYHITNQARGGTFRRKGRGSLTPEEWVEFYLRHDMFFPWSGLSADTIRRSLPRSLAEEGLPAAYRTVLKCRADQWERPRYGTQSPLNARFVADIFHDFPEARVIHVVRDPRDMVVSNLRRPEGSSSRLLVARFLRFRLNSIPDDSRLLIIRLEDLLSDREHSLRRVLEYVGEGWDDRVLEHWQHAPIDLPPFPWFRGRTRAPDHPRSRWQEALAPAWVRIVERLLGPALPRFGYEPATLDREPTRRELCAAVLRDLPAVIAHLPRLLRLTRALARRPPPDGADTMRLICALNPPAQQFYGEFTWPSPVSQPS